MSSKIGIYTSLAKEDHPLGKLDLSKNDDQKKVAVMEYLEANVQDNKNGVDEIDGKYLLLDKKEKKTYNLKKTKRKTLTASERKRLGLYKLKSADAIYEMYQPLHDLWVDYMKDLLHLDRLSEKNRAEAEMRLMKADLHGAVVMVTRSQCPSLVGQKGIILQETKHTFKLVTPDNKLKTIPKKTCVFTIVLCEYIFTIYGQNFLHRSSERAHRNFKAKFSIDS